MADVTKNADAIRKAIDGRADEGYSRVVAGDVVKVIQAIPEGRRGECEWTAHLLAGAMNNPARAAVLQTTGHLREVLAVFDKG
jgi:hypothetical protein